MPTFFPNACMMCANVTDCPSEPPTLLPLAMVDSDVQIAAPWPLDLFEPDNLVAAHDPFRDNGMHKKRRDYVAGDHATVWPPEWIPELMGAIDHIRELPITDRADKSKVGAFLKQDWFQDNPEHAAGSGVTVTLEKNKLEPWLRNNNLAPSVFMPALPNTSGQS